MEETFAGLIAEIEKVIKPLGFRIEEANRKLRSVPLIQTGDADNSGISITIIRDGEVG